MTSGNIKCLTDEIFEAKKNQDKVPEELKSKLNDAIT